MIDIRDHGASPLLTDNAAALQAAFNAAGVGGEVYIPAGRFDFSSKLTAKCHIDGPGELRYTGGATGAVLVVGDEAYDGTTASQQRLRLRDFTLTGKIGVQTGLLIRGVSRVVVDSIKVAGFVDGVGIRLRYTWIDSLRDCIVVSCKWGILADAQGAASGDQSANGLRIDGGEIAGCEYGVVIGDPERVTNPDPITGTKTSVVGATIEGCSKGAIWLMDGMGIDVSDCLFERNGYVSGATLPLAYPPCHIRIGTGVCRPTSITIRDNSFVGAINASAEHPASIIHVERCNQLRIEHNAFAVSGTAWRGVYLLPGADLVTVRENHTQAPNAELVNAGAANWLRAGILPGAGYTFELGAMGLAVKAQTSFIVRAFYQGVMKQELTAGGEIIVTDQNPNAPPALKIISVNTGQLLIRQ